MKQTAVEWLLENLISEPHFEEDFNYNSECWDKAKEMEKEQIIRAYSEGQNTPYEYSEDNEINWYDGPQYYKETYESKTD